MAPSAAAEVVEEAEGLRLHLSSNKTGYRGVTYNNGKPKPYLARYSGGSSYQYLGQFATAVEAAVFLARHVGEQGAPAITHQ
mgnify:CR=1 FL=1